MAQRTIWLTGNWEDADLAGALSWLRQCARLLIADDDVTGAPHAILIAQSRPGQIARSSLECWQARAPLARLVVLLGPWCEGQERGGKPWPGIARVPWRAWPTSLPLALGLNSPAQRLPRAATSAERWQAELLALQPQRLSGTAAVRTSRRATFESLQVALQACGLSVTWAADSQPVQADLEIIDGWEHWLAAAGPPRVLVLEFPRPDDLHRAAQLGAAAVLAQPLLLADLATLLARLIPATHSRRTLPSVA